VTKEYDCGKKTMTNGNSCSKCVRRLDKNDVNNQLFVVDKFQLTIIVIVTV